MLTLIRTILVTALIGGRALTAQAAQNEKSDLSSQFACRYYEQSLQSSRSIRDFVSVISLNDVQRATALNRLVTASELNVDPNQIFDFACVDNKLNLFDRTTGVNVELDFSSISLSRLALNGTNFEIKRDADLPQLLQKVRATLRAKQSACLLCLRFVPEAYAKDQTPVWQTGTTTFTIPSSSTAVQYTLTTLAMGSASELKYDCHEYGGFSIAAIKRRFGDLKANGIGGLVFACKDEVVGQMLRYMSGFANYSFQCKDSHVAAIDYTMNDYLDGKKGATASTQNHLEFAYQNGVLTKVTKSGNRYPETCTAKLLSSGDIAQVTSSSRSAPYCASNDFYEEMRGPDRKSRMADVRSKFHTGADAVQDRNNAARSAYYAKVSALTSTFDGQLKALRDQLSGDEETIEQANRGDDAFKARCGLLNHAECKIMLEAKNENEMNEVKKKRFTILKAVPQPQYEAPKLGQETVITLPLQKPFFDSVGASPDPAQTQSLHLIRKMSLGNLSPLANIKLANECCSNTQCSGLIEQLRKANGFSLNKFSNGARGSSQ